MKNEDQFFINIQDVLVCRSGNNILSPFIVEDQIDYYGSLENVYKYHQVTGWESRYVIMKSSGRDYIPRLNYESPISDICPQASVIINPTRKYKRELDDTYFKYYDDAEEVLNNIINFCKWLKKKIPTMSKKDSKKMLYLCEYLMKDVPDSQDLQQIRQSMIGLQVKRRSDLSSLERFNQDELDLNPSLR